MFHCEKIFIALYIYSVDTACISRQTIDATPHIRALYKRSYLA